MENIARRSLLLDYYGGLLTDKQREIFDLYHEQDLSLGEIAQLQGVSRNAVYDLLNRTEEKLKYYESVLGLIENAQERKKTFLDLEEDWQTWLSAACPDLEEPLRSQGEAFLERIKTLL